jgi:signal transduction histidine kinase
MAALSLRGSVRLRVTALATTMVAVLLAAVGLGLVVVQRRALVAGLDDTLRRRADALADVITADPPAVLPGSGSEDAAQLVAADGSVMAASPSLTGSAPIASDPGNGELIRTLPSFGPEGEDFRVLSRPITVAGERVVLHVAAEADDVADAVAALATSLAVAVPLTVAGLALVVWWVVGRALRPVEAIRTEVASIDGDLVDRRVPVPPGDDEIARLAGTMNAMLDRIDESMTRRRRFVADASHELRSPLTRIRSEMEVDLAHPEEADTAATTRSVLEDVAGLERLLDDLLHLARGDSDAAELRRETVDLDDVVFSEVARLEGSGVTIDVRGVSAAQVEGDRGLLARAVRNLLDNAVRHAATKVEITLADSAGRARLAVADDGPGIAPEHRERVFERFARADEGRSRDHGGTGLGLAIVRDIVTRHGGTVTIDGDGPGATFVVVLPAVTT